MVQKICWNVFVSFFLITLTLSIYAQTPGAVRISTNGLAWRPKGGVGFTLAPSDILSFHWVNVGPSYQLRVSTKVMFRDVHFEIPSCFRKGIPVTPELTHPPRAASSTNSTASRPQTTRRSAVS